MSHFSWDSSRRAFLSSGLVMAGGVLTAVTTSSAWAGEVTAASGPTRSPDDALKELEAGHRRFVTGHPKTQGATTVRRAELVEGQAPFAIVLGCSDSRVPPEIVFDQGLGGLFTIRVAGNTADPIVRGQRRVLRVGAEQLAARRARS
jgi:carbonic anhydrase